MAAAAAPFNGGVDYRRETAAAVYDPRTMPSPVVAPRGGGRRSLPSSAPAPEDLPADVEVDWSGKVVAKSTRKHVPRPEEVGDDTLRVSMGSWGAGRRSAG